MLSNCVIRGISSKAPVNASAAVATAQSASSNYALDSDPTLIKRRALKNGVKAAVVGKSTPRALVACAVKAGSREETYANSGISHALRLTSQLSTSQFSSFRKTRMIQQLGGNLRVTQGREYTLFSIESNVEDMASIFPYMMETILKPNFKTWEVHDILVPQMTLELNTLTPDIIATEALHKAAFQNQGLGNSLFMNERNLGKITTVDLNEFVDQHYNPDNMTVVGIGSDFENDYAGMDKKSGPGGVTKPTAANKFIGGDARVEGNGDNAYIALAAEGVARGKDAYAAAVLQKILGVGTPIKRGNGVGVLQKAVKAAVGDAPHAVSALNYNYAETGLVGAFLAVDASSASKALDASIKCLKSLKVTDAQVAAAKKRLLVENSDMISDSISLADSICVDTLFGTGLYGDRSNTPTAEAINGVTTAQVQAVAKKLSGKLAMGATGNLKNVPYTTSM